MKESFHNPEQPAPQTGEYAYTESQMIDMPEWMREGIRASQQELTEQPKVDQPLITEAPLTDEQRLEAARIAAEREAARAAEPVKHGGYTGVRISQTPGVVGGPIRIDTATNPSHGDPKVEKLD